MQGQESLFAVLAKRNCITYFPADRIPDLRFLFPDTKTGFYVDRTMPLVRKEVDVRFPGPAMYKSYIGICIIALHGEVRQQLDGRQSLFDRSSQKNTAFTIITPLNGFTVTLPP